MSVRQHSPRAWQTLRKRTVLSRGIAVVVVLLGVAGLLVSARVMTSRADDSSIITTNTSVPISIVRLMPCAAGGAGEVVSLVGDMHTVSHTWPDGNSGFDFAMHFNSQGLSGVGQTTGLTYQASGVVTEAGDTTLAGTSTFTFVSKWNLISQGSATNLVYRETDQVTVDASGPHITVVDQSLDCV